MPDSGLSRTKPMSEAEQEVFQSVSEKLDYSEIVHLLDIFRGEEKELNRYYGPNSGYKGERKQVAKVLVQEHTREVETFLNDVDNTFSSSNIRKNELERNLVNLGIGGAVMDEIEPTRRRLVIFAYHLLYSEDDFADRLKLLELNSRLFKETTERTYKYGRDLVNTDDLEFRVKKYVEQRNDELYRPFTIRYHEAEDLIYLDFYKETARVMDNVFKQRTEEGLRFKNEKTPTVTHKPRYTIKTLLCRIDTSSDDEVKFVYKSDPKSGWTREIERFFESLFSIDNPFDESNQEVDYGASRTFESVLETAQEDGVDETDIEDTIVNSLRELASESSEEVPEISDDCIQWVGIVVDDDDNTMIEFDDFTAQSDIQSYLQKTPGARERIFHTLNEVDADNLGLRVRSNIGDGESEEFIIWSKHWEEDSRVDDETRKNLNKILKGDSDDE